MKSRGGEFFARVGKVAFTDSVHSSFGHDARTSNFLSHPNRVRNWVTSKAPLNTPLGGGKGGGRSGCLCVSAGHKQHVYTSGYAKSGVFAFMDTPLSE
eukprot:TRINITY_DN6804_c0_g1_i1.p1 TRINITY_DN6804_c0_g1~~TRINITY_DN6804_c0_g1_i1.p1  ORF type:complete len:108 (-),score=11.51 TRINITY_DN6804_c0_g1_i1:38-331(-)